MEIEYKVPFSGRGHMYTPEEIQVVTDAMNTGGGLTQGPYQAEFERKFATKFGLPNAFAMNSCASALELSAVLTKVGPGDEVIIPSHTFAVSAIPFARAGAKLIWADIDPDTFLVSAKDIEKRITPRTKGLVVVHLYGLMCDMDPIMALARKHGLWVVEDVAQAIGATDKGRFAGSFGDFACYSFHSHKNMTTLGEGGMFSVKNPDLAKVTKGFRHNGMRAYEGERELYWQPCMTNVDFDWEGKWPFNYCIGEVQCALGSKLLDRVDQMNADRRRRAEWVFSELKAYPELKFQGQPPGRTSVHHLLPARFDGRALGQTRDDFMKRMAFDQKVRVVVQYYPLNRYPMFIRAGFGQADCPQTDAFFDNMVSFPFQHWMPEDQLTYMVQAIKKTIHAMRDAKAKSVSVG